MNARANYKAINVINGILIIVKPVINIFQKIKKYIALYIKNIITEKELESFINDIDDKIKYFFKEENNLQKIIEEQKITGEKEDNLKILKTVLANMEDSDREDLYNLFKLLIEKIDLIKRSPLTLKIYIK